MINQITKKIWFKLLAALLCVVIPATEMGPAYASSVSPEMVGPASSGSVAVSGAETLSLQPVDRALQPGQISIPSELGSVQEIFQGSKNTTVVHIQDAHGSISAQENIAKLVKHLHESYGINLLTVEGAAGEVDLKGVRDFPDASIREKVARRYLQSFDLTGDEYYLISENPAITMFGAERMLKYYFNRNQFFRAKTLSENLSPILNKFKIAVKGLEREVYGRPLRTFLEETERAKSHHEFLLRHIKNMDQILGSAFGEKFSHLQAAIQDNASEIDPTAFLGELESAEALAMQMLATTEQEKNLLLFSRRADLFQKLLNLSLSAEDYTQLESQFSFFSENIFRTEFEQFNTGMRWSEDFNRLFKSIKIFLDFYDGAKKRDAIFVKNTLNALRKKKRSNTILITGGFHTTGLTEMWRKENVSFVVIRPNMSEPNPKELERYQSKGIRSALETSKIVIAERGFAPWRLDLRERMLADMRLEMNRLKPASGFGVREDGKADESPRSEPREQKIDVNKLREVLRFAFKDRLEKYISIVQEQAIEILFPRPGEGKEQAESHDDFMKLLNRLEPVHIGEISNVATNRAVETDHSNMLLVLTDDGRRYFNETSLLAEPDEEISALFRFINQELSEPLADYNAILDQIKRYPADVPAFRVLALLILLFRTSFLAHGLEQLEQYNRSTTARISYRESQLLHRVQIPAGVFQNRLRHVLDAQKREFRNLYRYIDPEELAGKITSHINQNEIAFSITATPLERQVLANVQNEWLSQASDFWRNEMKHFVAGPLIDIPTVMDLYRSTQKNGPYRSYRYFMHNLLKWFLGQLSKESEEESSHAAIFGQRRNEILVAMDSTVQLRVRNAIDRFAHASQQSNNLLADTITGLFPIDAKLILPTLTDTAPQSTSGFGDSLSSDHPFYLSNLPKELKQIEPDQIPHYLDMLQMAKAADALVERRRTGLLSERTEAVIRDPSTMPTDLKEITEILADAAAYYDGIYRSEYPDLMPKGALIAARKPGLDPAYEGRRFHDHYHDIYRHTDPSGSIANLIDWAAWKRAGLSPTEGVGKLLAEIYPSETQAYVRGVGQGAYMWSGIRELAAYTASKKFLKNFVRKAAESPDVYEALLRVLNALTEIGLEDQRYRGNFGIYGHGFFGYTKFNWLIEILKTEGLHKDRYGKKVEEIAKKYKRIRSPFYGHHSDFSPEKLLRLGMEKTKFNAEKFVTDWGNRYSHYLRDFSDPWYMEQIYEILSAVRSKFLGFREADDIWSAFVTRLKWNPAAAKDFDWMTMGKRATLGFTVGIFGAVIGSIFLIYDIHNFFVYFLFVYSLLLLYVNATPFSLALKIKDAFVFIRTSEKNSLDKDGFQLRETVWGEYDLIPAIKDFKPYPAYFDILPDTVRPLLSFYEGQFYAYQRLLAFLTPYEQALLFTKSGALLDYLNTAKSNWNFLSNFTSRWFGFLSPLVQNTREITRASKKDWEQTLNGIETDMIKGISGDENGFKEASSRIMYLVRAHKDEGRRYLVRHETRNLDRAVEEFTALPENRAFREDAGFLLNIADSFQSAFPFRFGRTTSDALARISFKDALIHLYTFLKRHQKDPSFTREQAQELVKDIFKYYQVRPGIAGPPAKPFSLGLFKLIVLEKAEGFKYAGFKEVNFFKFLSLNALVFISKWIIAPIFVPFIKISLEYRKLKKITDRNKSLLTNVLTAFIESKGDASIEATEFLASGEILEEETRGDSKEFITLASLISLTAMGYSVPRMASESEVLKQGDDVVNIAVHGYHRDDDWALLEEGSRHSGANVIHPLHRGDIKFNEVKGKTVATLSAGIIFKDGIPYFVKFSEPLVLHYITDPDLGKNGLEKKARRAGVPLPGHSKIGKYTDDKFWGVRVLNGKNIATPVSLLFSPSRKFREENSAKVQYFGIGRSGMATISSRGKDIESHIRGLLTVFLDQHGIEEAVLKPNGGRGGIGVFFFSRSEIDDAVKIIFAHIQAKSAVLVQERIMPPLVEDRLDWNLRVFVNRNSTGKPFVSGMVVRADESGKAVNISQTAEVMTFDELAGRLKLPESEKKDLKAKIELISVRALEAIETDIQEIAKSVPWKGVQISGEPPDQLFTDLMGADVIVQKEDDVWVPYIMEVNDFHSGGMWDLDNRLRELRQQRGTKINPDEIGSGSRGWIETMIRRAKKYKESLSGFGIEEPAVNISDASFKTAYEAVSANGELPFADQLALTLNIHAPVVRRTGRRLGLAFKDQPYKAASPLAHYAEGFTDNIPPAVAVRLHNTRTGTPGFSISTIYVAGLPDSVGKPGDEAKVSFRPAGKNTRDLIISVWPKSSDISKEKPHIERRIIVTDDGSFKVERKPPAVKVPSPKSPRVNSDRKKIKVSQRPPASGVSKQTVGSTKQIAKPLRPILADLRRSRLEQKYPGTAAIWKALDTWRDFARTFSGKASDQNKIEDIRKHYMNYLSALEKLLRDKYHAVEVFREIQKQLLEAYYESGQLLSQKGKKELNRIVSGDGAVQALILEHDRLLRYLVSLSDTNISTGHLINAGKISGQIASLINVYAADKEPDGLTLRNLRQYLLASVTIANEYLGQNAADKLVSGPLAPVYQAYANKFRETAAVGPTESIEPKPSKSERNTLALFDKHLETLRTRADLSEGFSKSPAEAVKQVRHEIDSFLAERKGSLNEFLELTAKFYLALEIFGQSDLFSTGREGDIQDEFFLDVLPYARPLFPSDEEFDRFETGDADHDGLYMRMEDIFDDGQRLIRARKKPSAGFGSQLNPALFQQWWDSFMGMGPRFYSLGVIIRNNKLYFLANGSEPIVAFDVGTKESLELAKLFFASAKAMIRAGKKTQQALDAEPSATFFIRPKKEGGFHTQIEIAIEPDPESPVGERIWVHVSSPEAEVWSRLDYLERNGLFRVQNDKERRRQVMKIVDALEGRARIRALRTLGYLLALGLLGDTPEASEMLVEFGSYIDTENSPDLILKWMAEKGGSVLERYLTLMDALATDKDLKSLGWIHIHYGDNGRMHVLLSKFAYLGMEKTPRRFGQPLEFAETEARNFFLLAKADGLIPLDYWVKDSLYGGYRGTTSDWYSAKIPENRIVRRKIGFNRLNGSVFGESILLSMWDATDTGFGAEKDAIMSLRAPEPVGAYSHARRVGNTLYLAGMGPRKRGSKEIPGVTLQDGKVISYDIAAQIRSTFENVRTILEEAGFSWKQIVDVQVYLTNREKDLDIFNQLWKESFPPGDNQPQLKIISVGALPTPIAFEVKVIARDDTQPSGQVVALPEISPQERGDIEAQTRSVFANVRAALKEAGSSWERIIDVQVFLRSMAEFKIFNSVWAEFFPPESEKFPTRTTVEIGTLSDAIRMKVVAEPGPAGFSIAAEQVREALRDYWANGQRDPTHYFKELFYFRFALMKRRGMYSFNTAWWNALKGARQDNGKPIFEKLAEILADKVHTALMSAEAREIIERVGDAKQISYEDGRALRRIIHKSLFKLDGFYGEKMVSGILTALVSAGFLPAAFNPENPPLPFVPVEPSPNLSNGNAYLDLAKKTTNILKDDKGEMQRLVRLILEKTGVSPFAALKLALGRDSLDALPLDRTKDPERFSDPEAWVAKNFPLRPPIYTESISEQGKETLVLLHGAALDKTAWGEHVLSELAKKYRVIRVDLTGHGKSTEMSGENAGAYYNLDLIAADVKRALDQLGIKRATFVGHSAGGKIILSLATQYPGLVERATVIDLGFRKYLGTELADFVEHGILKSGNRAAYSLFLAAGNRDMSNELDLMREQAIPLQVIASGISWEHLPFFSPADQKHLLEHYPEARVNRVTGPPYRHNVYQSHPDEFLRLLKEFVDTTSFAPLSKSAVITPMWFLFKLFAHENKRLDDIAAHWDRQEALNALRHELRRWNPEKDELTQAALQVEKSVFEATGGIQYGARLGNAAKSYFMGLLSKGDMDEAMGRKPVDRTKPALIGDEDKIEDTFHNSPIRAIAPAAPTEIMEAKKEGVFLGNSKKSQLTEDDFIELRRQTSRVISLWQDIKETTLELPHLNWKETFKIINFQGWIYLLPIRWAGGQSAMQVAFEKSLVQEDPGQSMTKGDPIIILPAAHLLFRDVDGKIETHLVGDHYPRRMVVLHESLFDLTERLQKKVPGGGIILLQVLMGHQLRHEVLRSNDFWTDAAFWWRDEELFGALAGKAGKQLSQALYEEGVFDAETRDGLPSSILAMYWPKDHLLPLLVKRALVDRGVIQTGSRVFEVGTGPGMLTRAMAAGVYYAGIKDVQFVVNDISGEALMDAMRFLRMGIGGFRNIELRSAKKTGWESAMTWTLGLKDGELFDVILWNPPWYTRRRNGNAPRVEAWSDPLNKELNSFMGEMKLRLTANGKIYVVFPRSRSATLRKFAREHLLTMSEADAYETKRGFTALYEFAPIAQAGFGAETAELSEDALDRPIEGLLRVQIPEEIFGKALRSARMSFVQNANADWFPATESMLSEMIAVTGNEPAEQETDGYRLTINDLINLIIFISFEKDASLVKHREEQSEINAVFETVKSNLMSMLDRENGQLRMKWHINKSELSLLESFSRDFFQKQYQARIREMFEEQNIISPEPFSLDEIDTFLLFNREEREKVIQGFRDFIADSKGNLRAESAEHVLRKLHQWEEANETFPAAGFGVARDVQMPPYVHPESFHANIQLLDERFFGRLTRKSRVLIFHDNDGDGIASAGLLKALILGLGKVREEKIHLFMDGEFNLREVLTAGPELEDTFVVFADMNGSLARYQKEVSPATRRKISGVLSIDHHNVEKQTNGMLFVHPEAAWGSTLDSFYFPTTLQAFYMALVLLSKHRDQGVAKRFNDKYIPLAVFALRHDIALFDQIEEVKAWRDLVNSVLSEEKFMKPADIELITHLLRLDRLIQPRGDENRFAIWLKPLLDGLSRSITEPEIEKAYRNAFSRIETHFGAYRNDVEILRKFVATKIKQTTQTLTGDEDIVFVVVSKDDFKSLNLSLDVKPRVRIDLAGNLAFRLSHKEKRREKPLAVVVLEQDFKDPDFYQMRFRAVRDRVRVGNLISRTGLGREGRKEKANARVTLGQTKNPRTGTVYRSLDDVKNAILTEARKMRSGFGNIATTDRMDFGEEEALRLLTDLARHILKHNKADISDQLARIYLRNLRQSVPEDEFPYFINLMKKKYGEVSKLLIVESHETSQEYLLLVAVAELLKRRRSGWNRREFLQTAASIVGASVIPDTSFELAGAVIQHGAAIITERYLPIFAKLISHHLHGRLLSHYIGGSEFLGHGLPMERIDVSVSLMEVLFSIDTNTQSLSFTRRFQQELTSLWLTVRKEAHENWPRVRRSEERKKIRLQKWVTDPDTLAQMYIRDEEAYARTLFSRALDNEIKKDSILSRGLTELFGPTRKLILQSVKLAKDLPDDIVKDLELKNPIGNLIQRLERKIEDKKVELSRLEYTDDFLRADRLINRPEDSRELSKAERGVLTQWKELDDEIIRLEENVSTIRELAGIISETKAVAETEASGFGIANIAHQYQTVYVSGEQYRNWFEQAIKEKDFPFKASSKLRIIILDDDVALAKATAEKLLEYLNITPDQIFADSKLNPISTDWLRFGEIYAFADKKDIPAQFHANVIENNQAWVDFLIYLAVLKHVAKAA